MSARKPVLHGPPPEPPRRRPLARSGTHEIRAERSGTTSAGGEWALEVGGVRVEVNGCAAGPEMVAHLTNVAADALAAVLSGKAVGGGKVRGGGCGG